MHQPKISQMKWTEPEDIWRLSTDEDRAEEPAVVEEAPKKKKLHGLDIYVIFSIAALVIYTIVSQIMVVTVGASLDTLTTCFFGFFGGEIVTCALIKIFKLKEKKSEIDEGGGAG